MVSIAAFQTLGSGTSRPNGIVTALRFDLPVGERSVPLDNLQRLEWLEIRTPLYAFALEIRPFSAMLCKGLQAIAKMLSRVIAIVYAGFQGFCRSRPIWRGFR